MWPLCVSDTHRSALAHIHNVLSQVLSRQQQEKERLVQKMRSVLASLSGDLSEAEVCLAVLSDQ